MSEIYEGSKRRPAGAFTPSIGVIGGGIGGLAVARALELRGHTVEVFERANEIQAVGAGLLLTPNAVWALSKIGVMEEIRTAGVQVQMTEILGPCGKRLQSLQMAEPGADVQAVSISRSAVQRILLGSLCATRVHLGKEANAICPGIGGAPARVCFTQGDERMFDLVIAADGVRTVVRMGPNVAQKHRRRRYVGWRALVNAVPRAWEGGRVTESWADGKRFGIAPVSDGQTYWYATENVAKDWSMPRAQYKTHLLSRFCGWHAPIRDLIEATPEEEILLSPILESSLELSVAGGQVALVGDAAHAMTPNLGQGAAMALEDAVVLAREMELSATSADAISRYAAHRTSRIRRVIMLSRLVGELIQMENPLLWRIRNAGLSITPGIVGDLALAEVFRYRV